MSEPNRTPERDPRRDPIAEDVLSRDGKEREVDEVYSVQREGIGRNSMKYLRVVYVGTGVCSPEMTLRSWRKWAATAQIIKRGDA